MTDQYSAPPQTSPWCVRLFTLFVFALVLVSDPLLSDGMFSRKYILWFGYLLVIIGVLGRAYCCIYISKRRNEVLVNGGPYSITRNPLYLFTVIALVGIGLQSGRMSLLLMLIIVSLVYYSRKVRAEEAYLESRFGADYAAYKAGVPRWLPKLHLWNEPETIEVSPHTLRHSLMDGSILFLALPWFIILPALRASHILPVWLTLP